ncbi:hypothetical protein G6O69_11160 [Pseudenhygromyxa sp. WMMC2535]|uniref:hypothetical protein n=1 Tax=Pseudenhygromyxa sp. WMMC2535 TaxID=2712867 RepID=UPI00155211C0|nr:hypothetical protein [Pseudenhygromyxa sp. WMMC2535]NVB38390.1 hypothetical protein [Pseudenhygromyxa sp. WMMC2535]
MRRLLRSGRSGTLLLAGLLALTACPKTTDGEAKGPSKSRKERQAAAVQLPDPLELPAQPDAASWIAQPKRALDLLTPYVPGPVEPAGLVQLALGTVTTAQLAEQLAPTVDPAGAFGNVVLAEEEVIRLSVRSDQAEALAASLAGLEPVGEFGAVRLPSADPSEGAREWLAWIDADDEGALVLANSLPGLVTGRHLQAAYGERPLFFTLDPRSLGTIPVELPFSRVEGRGDFSEVVVSVQAIDGQDLLAGIPIAAGTFGGLLEGEGIVAGASSRYADYQAAVREVISQVNGQVAQLPFLVRGVGEGLAAKLNTALRTWDGRTLVALGPAGHLRVAYGASDVTKSRVAAIRLLQAVVDNVSTARNFMSQLPKLTFRRRVAKGDGQDIEMLVIHGASSMLQPELRPLVDDQGRLNVAMAWSERAGGGLIVVGPRADSELATWLDQTSKSPSGEQTQADLVAASFAAAPEQLIPLLGMTEVDQSAILSALIALEATGPRWQARARALDEPGRYELVLNPPPSAPPRANLKSK